MTAQSQHSLDVRPSPIAGQWYPANAEQLAASVQRYVSLADSDAVPGRVVGLLAPHAGHRYSGAVAGQVFALIEGLDVEVVAVVGPSHHPYSAALVTSGQDAYETPLGQIPVDHAALDQLRQFVSFDRLRHDPEHALEIELPFLQVMLGDFQLIPLSMLDQSWQAAERLGHALATVLEGRKALLVASSDLSHFYPQEVAVSLDHTMLSAVESFDPQQVLRLEDEGRAFACGRGAIAAVIVAARALGADTARIAGYGTSGDTAHDYSRVVGYGAAVFFKHDAA